MSVPAWHSLSNCGSLRFPSLPRATAEGVAFGRANGIKKCQNWEDDNVSTVLSVIDCQLDFIHPNGALCVPGAIEDTDRLCRFIYNNIPHISHIVPSLDSHYLFQCFHPFNWIAGSKPSVRPNGTPYTEGDNPEPFTVITLKDLHDDVWRAVRYPVQMQKYLEKLEKDGKKQLCIWPLHCILGTPGHAFDPAFAEAMFFHAAARGNQYDPATTKGLSPLSEHYGILQAEVQFPEDTSTQLNTRVVRKWELAERVIYAGQAKSHCVLATLEQIIALFQHANKNHLLEKLFVLEDCMSSVPDIPLPNGTKIEFDKMANARFDDFKKLGVKFIKSTDSLA